MQNHNQTSSLQKSVSWLAHSAAGMLVLLLTPKIIGWFKVDIAHYLGESLSQTLAEIGAWAFVICAIAFAFFALSVLLQFLVRLLFRASSRRGGGF